MMDKELRKDMLIELRKFYPQETGCTAFIYLFCRDKEDVEKCSNKLLFNLNYLIEHKLIDATYELLNVNQKRPLPKTICINAAGLDFLEDDGGLSAVLNTITVKFDADNIRELLAQGLLKTDLPDEKKGLLKKAIDGASSTALQTVTTKLVEMGMSHPGAAIKAVAGVFGVPL